MVQQSKTFMFLLPKLNNKSPPDVSSLDTHLKDKVVVVTGASRGLGKCISKELIDSGTLLALCSRNLTDLNKEFTTDSQDQVMLRSVDICQPVQTQKFINDVAIKFGRIDVLINNAGTFLEKPLENVSEEEYDRIFDTNLKGAFFMSKAVIPPMKSQRNGTIINIGSKISHNTNISPGKTLYAATKYALEGFSFALARELKSFGIRVTCLMPGTLQTFMSFNSHRFLSPRTLSQIIKIIIAFDQVDFESLVIKSAKQSI